MKFTRKELGMLRTNPSNRTNLAKVMFEKGRKEIVSLYKFLYKDIPVEYERLLKTIDVGEGAFSGGHYMENCIALYKYFKKPQQTHKGNLRDLRERLTRAYYVATGNNLTRVKDKAVWAAIDLIQELIELLKLYLYDKNYSVNDEYHERAMIGKFNESLEDEHKKILNSTYNYISSHPSNSELSITVAHVDFEDEKIKITTFKGKSSKPSEYNDAHFLERLNYLIDELEASKTSLLKARERYNSFRRNIKETQNKIQTRADYNLYMIRYIRLVCFLVQYFLAKITTSPMSYSGTSYKENLREFRDMTTPLSIYQDSPFLYNELRKFGYISRGEFTELFTKPNAVIFNCVFHELLNRQEGTGMGGDLKLAWSILSHLLDMAVQLGNAAIMNFRFEYQPLALLLERVRELEAVFASSKKLIDRAKFPSQLNFGKTIISEGDWYWEDIEMGSSDEEAHAGQHCGNRPSEKEGDTIYSLRRKIKTTKGEKHLVEITAIVNEINLEAKKPQKVRYRVDDDYQDYNFLPSVNEQFMERVTGRNREGWRRNPNKGKNIVRVMGESKGYNNSKPNQNTHTMIMKLLTMENSPIDFIVGGGYMASCNFHISDLSKENQTILKRKRPDLFDINYLRRKLGTAKFYRVIQNLFDLGPLWITRSIKGKVKRVIPKSDKEKFVVFKGDYYQLMEWIGLVLGIDWLKDDAEEWIYYLHDDWMYDWIKVKDNKYETSSIIEAWLNQYNISTKDKMSADDIFDNLLDDEIDDDEFSNLFTHYGVWKCEQVSGGTKEYSPSIVTSKDQFYDACDLMLVRIYEMSISDAYWKERKKEFKEILSSCKFNIVRNRKDEYLIYFSWKLIADFINQYYLNDISSLDDEAPEFDSIDSLMFMNVDKDAIISHDDIKEKVYGMGVVDYEHTGLEKNEIASMFDGLLEDNK